ncbi:MAG TPA: hypothetical protein VHH36_05840 [Candidatus Thermoplasmatota archaeon]|nr:hypothetical protein [Candidatus Thermoplasmatota archaeon]
MPERAPLRRRMSRAWSALTAGQRRRIVLGAMLALAVAAWDLLLLVVAGSLLVLSEMAPSPRPAPQPA